MAFSERLAPRTTTQVVEGKTSLTQNKTVKERKGKKEKVPSEDDGAATPLVLPRAKRPSTAQHGDVTVGTVLKKTASVLAKSSKPLFGTRTEVGKRSLLVLRSCYDRWRWLKHPLSGSSRSLEFGRRQNFRKQL